MGEEKTSYPLIPETPAWRTPKFYMVPSAGSRTPVEFTVDESGKVDLYF